MKTWKTLLVVDNYHAIIHLLHFSSFPSATPFPLVLLTSNFGVLKL